MDEIAANIIWTKKAADTFNSIIGYLYKEWSEKEVLSFINTTDITISKLSHYPEIGRLSIKRKNTRIFILNTHTTITYHFSSSKNQITILLFWNQRRNPKSFIY